MDLGGNSIPADVARGEKREVDYLAVVWTKSLDSAATN